MRPRRFATRSALCLVGAALAAMAPSATGVEKESLSISAADPTDEGDYSPIVSGGGLFVGPADCRTDVTCDTIPIELDPTGYPPQSKLFLQIVATLSWESEEAEGTNVPDLNLYLYEITKNEEGEEEEVEIGSGATSAQPERARAEWDERDPVTLYATVVNVTGGPSGYHLKVEAQGLEIKDIPKFVRPTAAPSQPRQSLAPTAQASLPLSTGSGPRETLKPVVTPGPDGPASVVALSAIDARSARSEGGAPWWVILISAVAVAGVLGGTGFFLVRRVRPRRA